jgi:hypothetical protein
MTAYKALPVHPAGYRMPGNYFSDNQFKNSRQTISRSLLPQNETKYDTDISWSDRVI